MMILLLISVLIAWRLLSPSFRILLGISIGMFIFNYSIIVKRGMKRIRATTTITNMKKNGKTGDLILFKSNHSHDLPDFLMFRLIPVNITNDIWNHIGILYRDPTTDDLYIWESKDEKGHDLYTNKKKTGVMMGRFQDIIKNYEGVCSYCSLKDTMDSKNFMKKVKMFNKYPYIGLSGIFGKPTIDKGISSYSFIREVLTEMGIHVKRNFILHPLAMVGERYNDPVIIAK